MQDLVIKYLQAHPRALFAIWILAAIGAWVINLPNWQEACTTQAVGSLLLGLAAVGGAGGAASIFSKINIPPTNGGGAGKDKGGSA
jgi:hypothetical protein